MELSTLKQTLKAKTLGLALAAFLIPAGMASAYDSGRPAVVKSNVSGHVDVIHQVPGGTVEVGVDWGKHAQKPVVVQEPRKVVVVEEKRHERRERHEYRDGRGHRRDREVTVIREEPQRRVTVVRTVPAHREVTVVRTVPARKEVVVVEKRHDVDRDGHQRIEYRK